MKNQVLSIKQMRHLEKLGVDTSKASLAWWRQRYAVFDTEWRLGTKQGTGHGKWHKIPTFTLQDMLEMMPKKIMIEMENDFCRSVEAYFLEVSLNICNDNWQCGYIHFSKREDYICHKYENTDLLTCTYEALCFLAENNYLKGGNDENK